LKRNTPVGIENRTSAIGGNGEPHERDWWLRAFAVHENNIAIRHWVWVDRDSTSFLGLSPQD
jgi:hypothetical protein